MGDRPPTPEETPNAFELSILDGTLTEDQRRTYQMILRSGVLVEDDESNVLDNSNGNKHDLILELAEVGKDAKEIAKELGKPLPVVRRVLEGK